jgi:zinc dependent phospholipase C
MQIPASSQRSAAVIAMILPRVRHFALLLVLLFAWRQPAPAYSLLTHQQLIDLTWQDAIVPFLLSRYPSLTPQQLDEARSYAYGGCAIQDIGYYPFGDEFFSDLTHYVRSGDFVLALFRNAHSANELAFAIGALTHYIGDSYGHSQATNRAVALQFPKLAARYGNTVNYAQGKHQHVQTEFAFDIDQITHHRLAPLTYLRHIGLNVPVKQLALAFYETYGITEIFTGRGRRFNISTYRFATRTLIPRTAYALTLLHRNHEVADPATPDADAIAKEAAAIAIENNWAGYRHRRASFETHLLAILVVILPKIGPLAMMAIKGPTAATEADYMHSVVSATSAIRNRLYLFTPVADRRPPPAGVIVVPLPAEAENQQHPLINRDLDTGQPVKPGGYSLTDITYATLLDRLTSNPTQPIPPGIKEDVQAYYADPSAPIITKKNPQAWQKVQDELKTLAAMPTSTAPKPYPTYGDDAANAAPPPEKPQPDKPLDKAEPDKTQPDKPE